jgi:hypothetical protein
MAAAVPRGRAHLRLADHPHRAFNVLPLVPVVQRRGVDFGVVALPAMLGEVPHRLWLGVGGLMALGGRRLVLGEMVFLRGRRLAVGERVLGHGSARHHQQGQGKSNGVPQPHRAASPRFGHKRPASAGGRHLTRY